MELQDYCKKMMYTRQIQNTTRGEKFAVFSISGLLHLRKLRISILKRREFAICGPAHLRNLRICGCGMAQELSDLRFAI
jgi:hypothetical protein